MGKYKNLILRILVSPFILGLMTIKFTYALIERWIYFIRYGGEWINYDKDENLSIQKIYELLKKTRKCAIKRNLTN